MDDKLETFLCFRKNFLPSNQEYLDGSEITHLKSLRLFTKDKKIEIRDGIGSSYFFHSPSNSKKLEFHSFEKTNEPHPMPNRLAGAIPKGNRLDWMLQKSTELGVTEIHFCNFERTVRSEFSMERADRILMEAASQSKRHFLPRLFIYSKWREVVDELSSENLGYLDPRETEPIQLSTIRNKIYFIGPEGGLGKDREEMQSLGLKGYKLGSDILRMETAYLYMASLQKQANLEIIY